MHASRESLPLESFGGGYESSSADWGEYMAYFERIAAGTDFTPYYDSCPVPHWGYVFSGKLRFTYDDGTVEDVSAGESYYIPPGHSFVVLEDAETIEFSPAEEFKRHMELVAENMEKAMAGEGQAVS